VAKKENVAKLKIIEIPQLSGCFQPLVRPQSLTQPNIHGTVGLQKPHKHGSNEDDRHLPGRGQDMSRHRIDIG